MSTPLSPSRFDPPDPPRSLCQDAEGQRVNTYELASQVTRTALRAHVEQAMREARAALAEPDAVVARQRALAVLERAAPLFVRYGGRHPDAPPAAPKTAASDQKKGSS